MLRQHSARAISRFNADVAEFSTRTLAQGTQASAYRPASELPSTLTMPSTSQLSSVHAAAQALMRLLKAHLDIWHPGLSVQACFIATQRLDCL